MAKGTVTWGIERVMAQQILETDEADTLSSVSMRSLHARCMAG